ncbi:flagellar hook protein FlgE [Vibrio xiamenensis]|uniref:Flagellar hook protein FlgE n=1 Tax=Vibrio xiamenensis TaxID=861298 RepID=A0A1G7ZYS8_9VIBR|nr:flagellar hook-basal body complex protein [Vibrio xiamenensis]SDH13781.1 flagellar hook protein FlgE [Vibrio xiamenensis]
MSFNIALSGLNASNQELNTISNNIANTGTTGFKESRTEFGSVYNGNQAGGVQVVGISQNFDSTGSISGTGRSLDLALTGGGFFVVEESNGQRSYTRSGAFSLDSNGYLVANSGGTIQGYTVDNNNNLLEGSLGALQVDTASLPAQATTNIEFASNLDARADVIDTQYTVSGSGDWVQNADGEYVQVSGSYLADGTSDTTGTYAMDSEGNLYDLASVTRYEQSPVTFDPANVNTYTNSYTTPVYDSLGNEHTLSQYFVKTGANSWEIHSIVDGNADNITTTPVTFDENGNLTSASSYTVNANAAGASDLSIAVNLSGLSQYGSNFVVSKNSSNGYTSGEFADIRVEQNGMVYATYSNGQSLLQGQLVLANFNAPQELMQSSNTSWTQTYGSGQPTYGVPGSGQFGELASGALEGSNVDLTSELVNLMTAQRNYQANTKTISTSDQLTQALFNAI